MPSSAYALSESHLSGNIFFSSGGLFALLESVSKHKKVLGLYLVPAFLYCLYNNLSFVNLSVFDPTTYFMFMQIRLLMTGIIYQVVGRIGKDFSDQITFQV